jgi:hypothetical protein
MAKAQKAKKKYRPKYSSERMLLAWADRIDAVADEKAPIHAGAATTVIEKARGALQTIIDGNGTLDHVSFLASQHGLALILCERDFEGSAQYIDIVDHAGMALKRCGERHLEHRKWGLDGPGIQALRDLIELREAQMFSEANTVGIERAALRQAMDNVANGHCLRFVFHPSAVQASGVACA